MVTEIIATYKIPMPDDEPLEALSDLVRVYDLEYNDRQVFLPDGTCVNSGGWIAVLSDGTLCGFSGHMKPDTNLISLLDELIGVPPAQVLNTPINLDSTAWRDIVMKMILIATHIKNSMAKNG